MWNNPHSLKTVLQILHDFKSTKAFRKVKFKEPDQTLEIWPENYFYTAESMKFFD